MKKILVIGSGGREHALVKALSQSPQVSQIIAAPGNGGIEADARCVPISVNQFDQLIQLAKEEKIDFILVGPEQPLTEGIVDRFLEAGLKILGPNQKAAILEASKAFTKDFLVKYQIPTAQYEVFEDFKLAQDFVESHQDTRWVVKVDGLASGKGVFIPKDRQETLLALEKILLQKLFGEQTVVVEEFLEGEELSFIALCDGKTALPLASSQDHKRLLDHDLGPNTGGMGAYSPALLMNEALQNKIQTQVIEPTLAGMQAEGRPFQGVLYAGLMIRDGLPYVLEYNVRFGDPEAQVILPRLKSDWLDLFLAAQEGRLDQVKPVWDSQSAVCVVTAAEGYPTSPIKGDKIEGLSKAEEIGLVYHAGTRKLGEDFVTAGGRVLGLTALGKSLPEAVKKAYTMADSISFPGIQYRKDIAAKGLKKLI